MVDSRRVYYDHEPLYQRIAASGGVGWDDLNPGAINDSYVGLDSFLASRVIVPSGATALDLGCGGGQAALRLARLGFHTHGIDFSETAIELARRNAHDAGLDISFIVGDCLTLAPFASASMDLIVDNHALHCIVAPGDRAAFLESARRVLKSSGRLFSDTMSCEEDFDPARVHADPATRIAHNGSRIWRSREELKQEFEAAGLRIIRQEVRANEPGVGAMIITLAGVVT